MKAGARFAFGDLFVLAAILAASPADAVVQVQFEDAEQYVDAQRFGRSDVVLRGIEEHLQQLGNTYLPAEVVLKIDVLDFDLAGGRDPTRHRARDSRVLRGGSDWPGARLRYSLESDGQVLLRGEETLADMDYTLHLNTYPAGDPLRYEKRMLDDWFKARFVEHPLPTAVREAPR